MWVFTTDGFFSVVQDKYCEYNEVMVRARCKDDLLKLCEHLDLPSEIIKLEDADYRWRIKMSRYDWARYVFECAEGLGYPNFKDTIPFWEAMRHRAYHECWAALMRWQDAIQ